MLCHDSAATTISTLSLHDALPISRETELRDPRPRDAPRVPHRSRGRVGRTPKCLGPTFRRRYRRVGRSWTQTFWRSEEHTSELQSLRHLVCRLLLEKKKNRHSDNC